MGNVNTLYASNPSEILPVESYLSDLSDTVESLGSTRFMKVAKARTSEGVVVYKVFVRHDNASLDPYPNRIIDIRKALAKAGNCCTIKRVLVRGKCAIILRIYQKHTLFDRLSTRPFVVHPEKIWYIFQLFKALSQCETAGICHGDLKSQNVLISSSNWLQITDFAPFKPSFLPQDNPSSYTFFFDTSRRHSCYIAPERFVPSNDYDVKFAAEKDDWLFGSLKPTMDIFSAGCIVYELLCDGKAPFTYPQLCEYRAMNTTDASNVLNKLTLDVPPSFRPLVKNLLNRDPQSRLSANAILSGASYSFPPILESFIYHYLDKFRPLYGSPPAQGVADEFSQPLEFSYIEPDDVIAKLKREKKIWFDKLIEDPDNKQFGVLFVSLITSNIRALRTIQSKTDAMSMLVELSRLCESSIAIDRILPYFLYLWNDQETQVRATSIVSTAELLAPIQPTTYEESLVFVDYIFPQMNSITNDSIDCPQHVLFAIATSLGSLADTAYKYSLAGRDIRSGTYDDDISMAENSSSSDLQNLPNSEFTALLIAVSAIFSSLCSRDPMVKRCLVEPQSLMKLYQFYNKIGNDDTLLRFLCTFLNAKTEWRLRAAFYSSLPHCVQKRSEGMVPLLQLGLQDYEEIVIVRTLGCINLLIQKDNLDQMAIKELLKDVLAFLVHPNEWCRSAICDILITLDQKWHKAEVHVKLIPMVKPFVEESKRHLLSLTSKIVLMKSLIEPIPRSLYTQITELNMENTKKIVTLLEIHFEKNLPFEASAQWFNQLFPKIVADPTRGSISDHNDLAASLEARNRLIHTLFLFRNLLEKMAETRNTVGMEHYLTRQVGIIDLSSKIHNRVMKKCHLYQHADSQHAKIVINGPTSAIDRKDTLLLDGEVPFEEERIVTSGPNNMRSSTFDSQVNSLLHHLNDLHMKNVCTRRSHPLVGSISSSGFSGKTSTNTLKGNIITHLHEHSGKIVKLSANRENEMFASCSIDGTVKIWKTKAVLGEGYGAARSEDTWSPTEGSREVVTSVGWCDQYVCASTQDGYIRWADVMNGGTKVATQLRIPESEGAPVSINANGPVCIVRTHHGVLYGLDLRVGPSNGPLKRHDVWRKMLREDHGLISCSAIDPWQQSWMVLGTQQHKKNLILYDLRFREEVLRWESPHKDLRPYGIWANPVSKIDGPEIFVGFNMHGEVSSFELSVQPARRRVLWTGGSPILSYERATNDNKQAELAHLNTRALCVCESTGLVYTGDTRGAIRKWNMTKASACEVLSAPPKGRTAYRTIFEEQPETSSDPFVIYERNIIDTDAKENRKIVPLDAKPSTYHRTPITDMLLLAPDLMVSSAHDGVIKVWK